MDSRMSSKTPGLEGPRVPISLEGERRRAMKLIFAVERSIKTFRQKWLADETDENVDDWVDFINHARSRHGQNFQFKSYATFGKELTTIKNDQGFLANREDTMAQLQRVIDRTTSFRDFYDMTYQRIENALEHYMAKYCLSYFAELDELDVDTVREYENNITLWQDEIQQCLYDAEKCMNRLHELSDSPFLDYIHAYGQVILVMNQTLDAFTEVYEPFRSWVTADEGYLTKVLKEIRAFKKERALVDEILRKKHERIAEKKSKELRSSFDNKKLSETLNSRIMDRRFCRKREFSFVDKIEMTENVLHEKKLQLESTLGRLKKRPLHSLVREPSDGVKAESNKLQKDVNRLEKQLLRMQCGKRNMRETRYNVQKDYHKLQGKYETSVKRAQKQNELVSGQVRNTRNVAEELHALDRKIKALGTIVEIKSHPTTVKKIYFEGYTPGEKIDFRGRVSQEPPEPPDTLREAIEVAATGVGKDWDKMYHTLPFNPPRTPITRTHDLEVIDMCFRGVHPPSEEMALRSLDKWTDLSKMTSVNALVRTLRTIKKTEVAKRIERKVLTVVN